MKRVVCIAALLASAGVILSAQGARDREFGQSERDWCAQARDADFCEVREETLTNQNVIDLDARGNGGVAVRAWDRPDVHVRSRVVVYADSEAEARDIARQLSFVTTGGNIRTEHPGYRSSRWRDRHRGWSVSYELEVPRNAQLRVDATNGGVFIEGVRGRVTARTINGGLTLEDVSGDITGETVNGGVRIDLADAKWTGAGLDARTVNGGIRLAVPADFSAELDARSSNGGVQVGFPVTVQGLINSRRSIRATLGAGGPRVRLEATNGGVTVTRR